MPATSFVIRVLYTENESWQGCLEHIQTGRKYTFKTTDEMLALMDTAVKRPKKRLNPA